MQGNKRIRYQGKLIYSYEDGVPTVLIEMNARTQMPTACSTAQPA